MCRFVQRLTLLLSTLVFLLPESALAVQGHGGAEGLVSHQLGHILFFTGMAYLLYLVYRFRQHGPGWGYFKGFLCLLMVWNLLTFVGHWLNELVDPEKFIWQDEHLVAFHLDTLQDLLYYLTRLDHLVLVPALLLLLLALKRWGQA